MACSKLELTSIYIVKQAYGNDKRACVYVSNFTLCIDFRDFIKFLVEVGGADTKVTDIHGRNPAKFAKELCQMQIMNYLNSVKAE